MSITVSEQQIFALLLRAGEAALREAREAPHPYDHRADKRIPMGVRVVEELTQEGMNLLPSGASEHALAPIAWSLQEVYEWLGFLSRRASDAGDGQPNLTWVPTHRTRVDFPTDPVHVAEDRLHILREELDEVGVILESDRQATVSVEIDREILARARALGRSESSSELANLAIRAFVAREQRRWKRFAKSLGGYTVDLEWESRQ